MRKHLSPLSIVAAASAALVVPFSAFGQAPTDAVVTAASGYTTDWAILLAFAGVAIATILPCIGSILGVSMVGQAGSGLLTEKPELAGKVITLAVLPGSQGLYGMVISLLFLFTYTPLIGMTVQVTSLQGLMLFAAFMPVTFTCLTSAPFQAKVCAAGMHMLAKDGRLAGRVITLAALVETYALLGFLISFFMLNSLQAALLGS